VTVEFRDILGKGTIHCDPIFGNTDHVFSREVKFGTILDIRCPKCESSLIKDNVKCPECGSSLFSTRSYRGSEVSWCTTSGCHYQSWKEIEAVGDREYVEVDVKDNGIGMDANTLSMIFEPFYSTKGTRGTGLGLAVSWGIIRNHGGNISVVSELGLGTKFTVRIPVEVLDSGIV